MVSDELPTNTSDAPHLSDGLRTVSSLSLLLCVCKVPREYECDATSVLEVAEVCCRARGEYLAYISGRILLLEGFP